jgi:hypothetical protein
MLGRSRWLVGSSSSRTSGSPRRTRARSTRRTSPAERSAMRRRLDLEVIEQGRGAMGGELAPVDAVRSGQRRLERAQAGIQPRLLGQIGDGGADPLQPLAAVQLDQSGKRLEQVDLPAPLRPTKQIRSASVTGTLSAVNSGSGPRRIAALRNETSGDGMTRPGDANAGRGWRPRPAFYQPASPVGTAARPCLSSPAVRGRCRWRAPLRRWSGPGSRPGD